jgi:hypothetical protein
MPARKGTIKENLYGQAALLDEGAITLQEYIIAKKKVRNQ